MVSELNFLAVLDDNFFKDKIFETAEMLDGTAEIIWFRFKDYNKTKKVFALGGINLENLDKIKDNFYGFAGIRIINDIIKSNF